MNHTKITYLAAALTTLSANAFAQGYTMQAVPVAPANESAPMAVAAPGASDHSAVVGHMGVGYMGAKDVPLAGAPSTTTAGPSSKLTAPVIGVRYWFNEKMGVDLGLGLALSGGSSTTTVGNVATTIDSPGAFAVLLHAGVPYVLASKKHYNFQIVPELNFGYASQTIADKADSAKDIKLTGMRFDVGARAGTELHFGFMGVPQLALQGSVGLFLRYDHTGASTKDFAANNSSTRLETSVGDKPWDIFTGNVSALYYF